MQKLEQETVNTNEDSKVEEKAEDKAQVRKIVIKTAIRAGQGKNRYGTTT